MNKKSGSPHIVACFLPAFFHLFLQAHCPKGAVPKKKKKFCTRIMQQNTGPCTATWPTFRHQHIAETHFPGSVFYAFIPYKRTLAPSL